MRYIALFIYSFFICNQSFASNPIINCPTDISVVTPQNMCENIVDYELSFGNPNCPFNEIDLKQHQSDNIEASYSCSSISGSKHLRVFNLNDFGISSTMFVNSLEVGIGFTNTSPQLTVNLYSLQGNLSYNNMTLLASQEVTIPDLLNSFLNVPIAATLTPDMTLVVEVIAPIINNNAVVGYNTSAGQSAPSYIVNPDCGFYEPINLANIGQPNLSFLLKVHLSNLLIEQTAGLPSGSAFPVGTTTNSFLVSDATATTSSCSFDVTVIDQQAPLLVCPTNLEILNDAGACGAFVNFEISTVENCPNETITQLEGLPSGAFFPIGTTLNTFRAIDTNGQVDTCRFDVKIVDHEAPVIVCPQAIIQTADAGDCQAIVIYELEIFENCSHTIIEQLSGLPSGHVFPVGTISNSFMATDEAGNTATCSFTVTVTENSAPSLLYCPENSVVELTEASCETIVTYDLPMASDNCTELSYSLRQHLDNTINNSYGCLQNGSSNHLRVFDLVQMGISTEVAIDSISVGVGFSQNNPSVRLNLYTLEGALSYANMTLVASKEEVLPNIFNNTHTIEIEQTIPANSILVVEFVVPLDTQAPFLAGYNENGQNAPSYYASAGCGNPEITNLSQLGFPDFSLVMTVYGKGTAKPTITQTSGLPSGSAFPLGSTSNAFDLTDLSGNTTQCSFTIDVVDARGPEITCPNDISFEITTADCQTFVTIPTPTAFDACGEVVSISNDYTNDFDASAVYLAGNTIVTWTATDQLGNTSTCETLIALSSSTINAVLSTTDALCSDSPTGTANIEGTSGTPPYSYEWETGATTASISDLFPGTYAVTMTDFNGCMFSSIAIINTPEPIVFNAFISHETDAQMDGIIDTDVTGGTLPYSYNWSTGSTAITLEMLSAATYTLTITDANNCTASFDFVVENMVSTTAIALIKTFSVSPNPASDLLHLSYELSEQNDLMIQVFDAQGQEIKSILLSNTSQQNYRLQTQDWQEGMYFIRLSAKGKQQVERVLILR